MKKMFLLVFVCLSLFAYGLDVDVEELSATKDTSVEFVNYEGPHSKIETIEQIKGIGRHLGRQVTDSFGDFTYAGKYRVIHAVDPADSKGMDADIFLILPAAQVDHIINIRRIISGFLEAAYQYSAVDADLLAEFITVYNAVFRGRMDYFNERYKQIVIRNLDAESVGISTVYTQWPGKTRMVIPLTGAAADGGIGSLDSDMLTEKEVIEKLQTEDDKGLDIRKDMTELKEREVEVEQERIDADKEALEDEQQRIAAEQQRLQEEKERIAKEKAEAEDEEAQRALAEREAALKAEEEKLRREEEDAAEKSQELNEREEDQAERVERIQQEREEIAEDARELIGQESTTTERTTGTASSAAVSENNILFIIMSEATGEPLGRLARINETSGKIVQRSSINTIRKRRIDFLGNDILALAGTNSGQGAVRLVLINSDTLETIKQGDVDIFPDSVVVIKEDSVYAVVAQEESWFIGKFDEDLSLTMVSNIAVMPFTSILNVDDTLYALGQDDAVHVLSDQNLADLKKIE